MHRDDYSIMIKIRCVGQHMGCLLFLLSPLNSQGFSQKLFSHAAFCLNTLDFNMNIIFCQSFNIWCYFTWEILCFSLSSHGHGWIGKRSCCIFPYTNLFVIDLMKQRFFCNRKILVNNTKYLLVDIWCHRYFKQSFQHLIFWKTRQSLKEPTGSFVKNIFKNNIYIFLLFHKKMIFLTCF